MQDVPKLPPPGQRWHTSFPRFGLPKFASRFPAADRDAGIEISGAIDNNFRISLRMISDLPKGEICVDFHCVTTWSVQSLVWNGVFFKTLYDFLIVPRLPIDNAPQYAVIHAHDGYRACFLLEDLLRNNVLLAETLQSVDASMKHGLPFRLIAPDQYGYKSVKFVKRVEFCTNLQTYRASGLRFMEHQRARVALEERAKGLTGFLLRWPYRLMVRRTSALFEKEWQRYKSRSSRN